MNNAEEAEVEWFYEDLQDLLELTHTKKDILFIIGDCNAKVGSQETPRVTGKFGIRVQRLTEFCKENTLVIANTLFQQHKTRSVMTDSLWPHESQHTGPPCPSPTPGVYPNPCSSSRWCHPTISSSVIPFSSCPQSFSASGTFQVTQLSASGGQSIGVSASESVLAMNTQDWSPLGWTGWISLQSKGLSRVFSSTTVQKHQFFGAQL